LAQPLVNNVSAAKARILFFSIIPQFPPHKKLDFVDDSLAVSFRESSVTRPIKWKATHERLRLGFSTDSASDMPIIASKNGLKKLKFFLLLVSNAFFAITRCLNDRQSLKCLSPSSWPSFFTSACGGRIASTA
jgi:hypothetical protein